MKKKLFLYFGILITIVLQVLSACCKIEEPIPPIAPEEFIRAADMSFLPLIESENTIYYNATNQVENALTTLKNAGCNTIRIRLWKNPTVNQSTFLEVKNLANRVRNAGMKVWLSVHYSDTWADPANQTTPLEWQSLSFANLSSEVANYTASIVNQIQPDIIQIGNEINDGFLWPNGKLSTNENQFLELLAIASYTIRTQSPNTKIMLHYAGIGSDANYFFING
jgi:arabinogalactan endo-1,4-beta-galactosidase